MCSSQLLSRDYLAAWLGNDLIIVPSSISFIRQFLVAQFSILANFCILINQTVNVSLTHLLRQQLINAEVLTVDQFYEQSNATIKRFHLDMSLSLRHTLDYLQAVTHGNAIMSSYTSNWEFKPSPLVNFSTIRTRPVWYGNCSCAISAQCSSLISIGNITFPGLYIGCLPSSVLLQSTLECFYNQTCLDALHYALFESMRTSALVFSSMTSERFLPNTSVGSIFDELFVEQWLRQSDYEAFFQSCAVSTCTYTDIRQANFFYVVTTITGFIGGLIIVLRVICPMLVAAFFYSVNLIRKTNPEPVQT